MLTRLTVVIISQYIQISNHVVHLKLIKCYTSIISQLKKKAEGAILLNKVDFSKDSQGYKGILYNH